jgi:L,D-transpeptidase ErfK/SrfK
MCIKHIYNIGLVAINLFLIINSHALTFEITSDNDMVGEIKYVTVKDKETLFDIAVANDLGMFALMEANPGIKPNKVKPGTKILLPCAFILPPGPREGIVLNLAELRIYYYHPNSNLVSTYPVGIGRIGWKTPVGITKIVKKRERPSWIPPDSIREHYEQQGKILPDVIPPGPNNPLGNYAITLAWPGYLIHGTNQQNSVGLRSSSGCIRMYAEDIKDLFNKVTVETTVTFIHNPFKIGKAGNKLFLEAHRPLPEPYYGSYKGDEEIIKKDIKNIYKTQPSMVNWNETKVEMKRTFGYPVLIGIFEAN